MDLPYAGALEWFIVNPQIHHSTVCSHHHIHRSSSLNSTINYKFTSTCSWIILSSSSQGVTKFLMLFYVYESPRSHLNVRFSLYHYFNMIPNIPDGSTICGCIYDFGVGKWHSDNHKLAKESSFTLISHKNLRQALKSSFSKVRVQL